MKGIMRFGNKGKLSPHYIGPFEILEHVGAVAYQLALPPDLSMIHPVFHVSMLWKYMHDPSHVLTPQTVRLDENLCHEEESIVIVDWKIKKLSKEVASMKVIRRNHIFEEATWEVEEAMRGKYPQLFETLCK